MAHELGANPHVLAVYVVVAVPHSAVDTAVDWDSLAALVDPALLAD